MRPGRGSKPADLGDRAAAALLAMLGFTQVIRDDRGYVTAATPTRHRATSRPGSPIKYGRAVATAFTGGRAGGATDGGQVYLDVAELRRSVNYRILEAGWVYPTFYSKLYVDLRDGLAATAIAARTANQGVWDQDATLPGFRLNSRRQLTDELVILPKLLRRLAEYLSLEESGKVSLAGFPRVLGCPQRPAVHRPRRQATAFDTLVARRGQSLQLTLPPEQIVFQEG